MKPLSSLMLCAILLCSCTATRTNQQLYYATHFVTPYVTEQDMISANVSANFSDGTERSIWGGNADVAYSPIKNMGVAGGYSFNKNKGSAHYSFNSGEIMVGYHVPINNFNTFFVSIYGGDKFGNMSANNYFDSSNNFRAKVTANFNDLFLQPSFIYVREKVSMQAGMRITWRNYSNIKHYYNSFDEFIPGTYYFVQPFYDMAFGVEKYKIFFKYSASTMPKGRSYLGGDKHELVQLFWSDFSSSVSIGVRVDIKNAFQINNRLTR